MTTNARTETNDPAQLHSDDKRRPIVATTPDLPAIDAGDEDPDLLAGDPVDAEHDLDIDAFADEEDDQ